MEERLTLCTLRIVVDIGMEKEGRERTEIRYLKATRIVQDQ